METSGEFNKFMDRYKVEKQSDSLGQAINDICITSIQRNDELNFIDLETLNFNNEETWLYTCKETCSTSDATDVNQWLHSNTSDTLIQKHNTTPNSFDTRTFTRPKKRFNLLTHSFEKESTLEVPSSVEGGTTNQVNSKPLQFDLSQPIRINNFDQILESATDCLDSFQNMSPPSLCSNSMCSSTLTNLLETSYIRHLDLESDSILIQSITSEDQFEFLENDASAKYNTFNKYSHPFSITKGTEENDSRATIISSQNTIVNKEDILEQTYDASLTPKSDDENVANTTFTSTNENDTNNILSGAYNNTSALKSKSYEENILSETLNASLKSRSNEENILSNTYNASLRSLKTNDGNILSEATFKATAKANVTKENHLQDATFTADAPPLHQQQNRNHKEHHQHQQDHTPKKLNSAQTFTKADAVCNSTFSRLAGRKLLNSTYQKLSDSQPDLSIVRNADQISEQVNDHRTIELTKTNAIGSTDSLDERLSCYSDSSKDSHHIFNVEDWEAIAKSQELSLQQGISTPKPNCKQLNRLFNVSEERFSPIVKSALSDSDVSLASSTEECNSLRSASAKTSSHGSLPNAAGMHNRNRYLQRPEGFMKPAGTTDRKTIVTQSNNLVGPRSMPVRPIKPSGLPRPATAASTGIPRPMSRIPGPKFTRPSALRSNLGSRTGPNEKPY